MLRPFTLRLIARQGIRLAGILLLTACGGATDPSSNLLDITAPDFTVPLAGTLQIDLFATNASGERLPMAAVQWSSDNVRVASVSSTGVVEGRSFGSATITATLGSLSDALVVTVTPAAIEFSMTSGERIMAAGATTTLTARAVDALGATIAGSASALTWTSSNENIAVVRADPGANGGAIVTGVDLGLATIVASAFGLSQSFGVVVLPAGSDADASVRVQDFRLLELPVTRFSPQIFAPVMRVMMRNEGEPLTLARVDFAIGGVARTLTALCTDTDLAPGQTWDLFGTGHFMDDIRYNVGMLRIPASDVLALLTFRTTTGARRGLVATGRVEPGTPPGTLNPSPVWNPC